MGEIFLAKAGDVRGFEKLYTIKKILPHLSHDPAFLKRFTEEAQLAIKLTHINITPVFEVGMVDEDLFLALEFVDGRDLRRLLSQCHKLGVRIPQDIALYIARETANGLAYAHRRTDERGAPLDLVHCDISPPNILVSFEGEIKIIDFGVARSALGLHDNEPATGFGKLGYMAPEQLLKGRHIDRRTDLYSLGVVLYEMLVGDRMFSLDPKADHKLNVRKIVLDPVEPPSSRVSGLDHRLDKIVMKAVSKDPKDRFQDATEFRKRIQMVLAEINPTISPDDVGHFLKETFLDEMEQDRTSLQEAHAMDLAPYMERLHDAGEATVSYAVTNMWDLPDPLSQSTGSDVAAQMVSEPVLKPSVQPRGSSNWILALAAGFLILAIVITALALYWPFGDKDSTSAGARQTIAEAEKTTDKTRRDGVEDGVDKEKVEEETQPQKDGRITEQPPDEDPADVTDDSEHPRKGRRTNHVRKKTVRSKVRDVKAGEEKDSADESKQDVDSAAVLSKFRRVEAQYKKFKARYGGRLESRWQAILNAAVYSGADKYNRLDKMLDSLVRQMRAIEKDEGES